MPSLLSSRRAVAEISLHGTSVWRKSAQAAAAQPSSPSVSWPVVALVGAATTAAASWILCAGVTVLGWLGTESGTLRRRAATWHLVLAAEQWRRRACRRYPRHAGALGRDRGDRLHDLAICSGERSAGSCRPESDSRADQYRHHCRVPAACSCGGGVVGRAVADSNTLGLGDCCACGGGAVGRQPESR